MKRIILLASSVVLLSALTSCKHHPTPMEQLITTIDSLTVELEHASSCEELNAVMTSHNEYADAYQQLTDEERAEVDVYSRKMGNAFVRQCKKYCMPFVADTISTEDTALVEGSDNVLAER